MVTITPAAVPALSASVGRRRRRQLQRRAVAGHHRDREHDRDLRPDRLRAATAWSCRDYVGPDRSRPTTPSPFPIPSTRVSALDAKIDDLYRLPLGEFTGARNALAKSLSKDDAKLVKALEKPTVVPWAVNQVYWRARSTYDRLMKSGEKLRAAQIAALEGRAADVRAAERGAPPRHRGRRRRSRATVGRRRRQTRRRRARPHVRIALARHQRAEGAGTADRRASARRVRGAGRAHGDQS